MTELEDLKSQRDAVLYVLGGLKNAPRTKIALEKHLKILEKQIGVIKNGLNEISPFDVYPRQ